MSSLLYLSSDDFVVQKGPRGNMMVHGIPGYSLIMFYSTYCQHCQGLIPIFKKLPGSINGCQFGMLNVSMNRDAIEMSQDTISPIKYVPYILLYINGKPFMKYSGPPNESSIKQFIIEVATNMQSKQQFSREKIRESADTKENGSGNREIPSYTTGIPVCSDNVCYLEFVDAYQS